MVRTRVIPCLLLQGTGLVKTTRFAQPKYVGDPINAVRIFNDKEADELLLFDINASKERRGPNVAFIEQIVSEAFMPVCFGGGVRSVEQARALLKAGVEKIAVNTSAIENLQLVRQLAEKFGSQCVVGAIDVRKRWLGRRAVHSHSGARVAQPDPLRWAEQLVDAGAGEIFLQSVDRDGTMTGYDLELLRSFDGRLPVPLVAAGGAGSVDDMIAALRVCCLSGLAVGARFVYHGPHRAVLINYLDSTEMDRIRRVGDSSR